MSNLVFNQVLGKINYTPSENLKNGEIARVFANNEDKELTVDVIFPYVPPIDELDDFNKNVKERLIEYCSVKKVNINYDYKLRTISADELNKWYCYTLEALIERKVYYRGLTVFDTFFYDNEVVISIGEGNDEQIVKPLYEMVEKSFKRLGVDFVKFSIIITPLILPTNKKIEKSIEEDVKNAMRFVEKARPNKTESSSSEPNNVKGYKLPKVVQNKINGKTQKISSIPYTESDLVTYNQKNGKPEFVVSGYVESASIRTLKGGSRLYEAIITDDTDAITIKTFINENNGQTETFYATKASEGNNVRVYGFVTYDQYSRDIVLRIIDIISYGKNEANSCYDDSLEKRVELHAHSKMTAHDSVLDIKEYVKRALEFGHTALALTDKNSVQGLGEFEKALKELDPKKTILPIYGMEGYYVDEDKFKIAFSDESISLKDATFVVYDFETTGLSPYRDDIIEIGACKVKNGEIIDTFSSLINPKRLITEKITKLTTITNDDLRYAPYIEDVLPKFIEFYRGSIMVAHNAAFDNSHLLRNLRTLGLYENDLPTIDTMNLAMARYRKKISKFGLDGVRKAFGVELEKHHRAFEDAKATTHIFIKMYNDFINDGIYDYNQINSSFDTSEKYELIRPNHITLLAKNRDGLININRLVSDSNCEHFHRTPRIIKEVLEKYRDNLLIGSGCFHGEIFNLAINGNYEEMKAKVDFYDFLEVQPVSAYQHLAEPDGGRYTLDDIKDAIKLIIKLGKECNKLVCATGDVHELNKEDTIYKKILYNKNLVGGGIHEFYNRNTVPSVYYRTTKEMLSEFNFLDEKTAYEIVVTNTNIIAKMITRYKLFPSGLFAITDNFMEKFGVPSAKQAVHDITYQVACERYGEKLPKIIKDRIEKELNSIIGKGYAPIYYISHCLVKHSKDAGYIVGSRGSVGSSLVATFMKITEVNSLPAHYLCPDCKFTAFQYTKDEIKKYSPSKEELELQAELVKYESGLDLPSRKCPICGGVMNGDGYNIPFETFLGFDGDKIPDIDLNFSGEYQTKAHDYCREIFGKENTYRGGTIGTIASKTAENYVTSYYSTAGGQIRKCKAKLIAPKLDGVKRTTGQHPGGIVVVPEGVDINEITPVQYPADAVNSEWKTTHIDYHKFESNLLKLDILGHDDPTMIRFLMDFVDKNPSEFPFNRVEDIPLNDPNVLNLFNGVEVINVDPRVVKSEVASTGIPEFGTKTTKEMLVEIRPTSISDLVKISGLSHGKGIWTGNLRDLFLGTNNKYDKINFEELIGCRDDIMTNLIAKGVPAQNAFKIMESVRKGRGLTEDMEKEMQKHGIEEWFIESCKQIKYLFPKAHAAAYVLMALRIAWFKLYKPLYYYSGFFSKRTDAFDVQTMMLGINGISAKIDELSKNVREDSDSDGEEEGNVTQNFDKSDKEIINEKAKKTLIGLRVALEMVARGYHFIDVHINKSDATDFIIEGNGLRIPFVAIDSFGESTAKQIVSKRGDTPFTSIKDVSIRGKVSPKLIEKLMVCNAFDGLPKEDEIGLFKYLKENKDSN